MPEIAEATDLLAGRMVVHERSSVFRIQKFDRRLRLQELQALDKELGETIFMPTAFLVRAGIPGGRQTITIHILEFDDGSVLSKIALGTPSRELPADLKKILDAM